MRDTAALTSPDGKNPAPTRYKKLLSFGVLIAVVLICVVFAIAYYNVSNARSNMEEDIKQRQEAAASSRAEATGAWLASLADSPKGLLEDRSFRLFALQLAKFPDGEPLLLEDNRSGSEEFKDDNEEMLRMAMNPELLRTFLYDFVTKNGFLFARVVNSKGQNYISNEAVPEPLTELQISYAAEVMKSGRRKIAPLRFDSDGFLLEFYIPIFAPGAELIQDEPVAVFMMTKSVTVKISEMLTPSVQEPGRRLALVQDSPEGFQAIVLARGRFDLSKAKEFTVTADGVASLPFARRINADGSANVYSSGFKVVGADWWIVSEFDAEMVDAALSSRAKTTYGLAALVAAVLALIVLAGWWWLIGREQGAVNDKFKELLAVIDEQKKLLDGINSTITDPISLTDVKGVYQYVNRAFAQAIGRTPEQVVGLDGPAVFGFDTAKRLNTSDQYVIMTGESISVNELIWLQSKRYYFQIAKTPLRDPATRTPQGIVAVYRDITKLVETEERGRRAIQQTIDALVRTIEEADPFLGGHSRIMSDVAKLTARHLNMSDSDVATVEAAANLSQVGKMFVPRDIILKPGALSQEEKKEMEKHVDHAYNVLKNIEFDLPVLDAIMQMNERLDGNGYPKGLAGDQISMHARILAVANAFAAMARPRSYRTALPVGEVLNILDRQAESYDPEVVTALRETLATPAGERVVQLAASSKGS